MKSSKQQTAETREKIVKTASRLFRQHGVNGIGVADLMKQAGLTHGGFYKHFSSKESLLAEACTKALTATRTELTQVSDSAKNESPICVLIDAYLSSQHRDHPELGCAIAALGPESVQVTGLAKNAMSDGVNSLVTLIQDRLERSNPGVDTEQTAHAVLSSLVGSLILSRIVNDPKRADAFLEDTKSFLKHAL